jgi:hypothetical protein
MNEYRLTDLIEELPDDSVTDVDAPPAQPAITFMGNAYDLAALGALAGGLLGLFVCLTCSYGAYCLPLVPLVLGLIGLLTARQAVDEQRTRTMSWIALGIGGGMLLLMVVCIVLYIGILVLPLAIGGSY